MWTSILDLDPKRVLVTQLLMHIWPGACFSSFAPLQVQNLPRQPLQEKTWVRVRNRLAGICGSDLHLIQGDGDFHIAPAALSTHNRSYPGHEVIGEVLEVGEDVQHLRVGDRVVLQHSPNCLSANVQFPCRSCIQGYYNLCEHGKLPGPQPIGGGWSEEMLLPEQQLFRLSNDISDEQAVLLEPTAVALHAVLQRLPQKNERILIIGAGTIGLLTLQIIRAVAPQAEVSVLARHSFQIEQATRMGAAHIIYPQNSYTDIQRATGAQLHKGIFDNKMLLGGYDVIFDTVGNQKTLHHALRWARMQATIVLIGINLHQMNIDLTPIWYQEVKLIGSMGSSTEIWPPATQKRSTFDIATDLIRHTQIHPEYLITHRFPINHYQTALATAAGKVQNHAIKVVFDYSLLPPSVVPNVRASAVRKHRSPLLDESPSLSENQISAEEISLPALPLESPVPASLSALFSSSHTVAPPTDEDDEFNEMEDTISAPAIAKGIKQASATLQQKEEFSTSEENKISESTFSMQLVPMTPSSDNEAILFPLLEQSQSQDSAESPDEEIHPIVLMGPSDEITEPTDETVKVDAAPSGTDIAEHTTTKTTEPTDEIVEIDAVPSGTDVAEYVTIVSEDKTVKPTDEIVEIDAVPSEVDITEHVTTVSEKEAEAYTHDTPEYMDEISYTPEYMDETPDATEYFDETFDTPAYFDEVLDIDSGSTSDTEESSEASNRTVQSAYEMPETALDNTELFTLNSQNPPSLSGSNQEEENRVSNATEHTENTLLHTEGQQTTKVQNRTRARTRKKNNRISLDRH